MTFRRRSDRVKRLTIEGWKTAEVAQLLVSSVTFDLRDALRANALGDAMESASAMHQALWKLYEAMLSVDPPLPVSEAQRRLEDIIALCVGPLEPYRARLERARDKLS
ncbi:MAG: hypothetical protein WD934_11270 [Gemmatimonadales bacterium]